MPNFALDPRHLEIVKTYADFNKRWIVPNRMKYDLSAEFPHDVIDAANKEGLMNPFLPAEYGGKGYSIFDSSLASEQLAYGCIGISICYDANCIALIPVLDAGTPEQKKQFFGYVRERKGLAAFCLTEPDAGSDVAGIKTTATKSGDKYILRGKKRFITNGEQAAIHTVFAITDPERGARSLSCFIVPRELPGVKILSRMDKMGQRASCQNEIEYDGVEVPAFNLLGKEGLGFKIAMRTLEKTRLGVASASLGVAKAAFDYSRDWAGKRIQFGKPITVNQGVSFLLANMAIQIEAAQNLIWKAAWAHDTGAKDAGYLSSIAKCYASDTAMNVTTDAVQVMGGEGYSRAHPVEKMMRDAKLCQIYEGTNQVQRLIIAKSVLG